MVFRDTDVKTIKTGNGTTVTKSRWWFCQGVGGSYDGKTHRSLDLEISVLF